MKATCIRDCTVPGRGLVVVGQVIDAPAGEGVEKLPYLKHFKLEEVAQAASVPAEKPKAEAKPKGKKGPAEDFLN